MSNSESMYREFSLFNDVEDSGLKAWNRLHTVNNLKEMGRRRDAAGYLDKLDEAGRAGVGLLLLAIKKKGIETVQRELNRSIV